MQASITKVYQAPLEFAAELREELLYRKAKIYRELGSLFLVENDAGPMAWAEWTWTNAKLVEAVSIGSAAKTLKAAGRIWQPNSVAEHRRTQLIADSLSLLRPLDLHFGVLPKLPGFGTFALLSRDEMLYATEFFPALPHGRYPFHETKEPPSRAYLKLWEALTRAGKMPKAGERCVDLGSSPGGWTWVLAKLGTEVLSIDRAEIAPNVLKMPGVTWEKGDAFARGPKELGKIDWLVSDVICYPEKLFGFVEAWLASGNCKNFICTIKFQGAAEPVWIDRFRTLGGQVVHLSHNKHELTWIYTAQ